MNIVTTRERIAIQTEWFAGYFHRRHAPANESTRQRIMRQALWFQTYFHRQWLSTVPVNLGGNNA